jgi:hypothetical protein
VSFFGDPTARHGSVQIDQRGILEDSFEDDDGFEIIEEFIAKALETSR